MDTKKVAVGIRLFGLVLIIAAFGLIFWSLMRAPVTTGPELPVDPATQTTP